MPKVYRGLSSASNETQHRRRCRVFFVCSDFLSASTRAFAFSDAIPCSRLKNAQILSSLAQESQGEQKRSVGIIIIHASTPCGQGNAKTVPIRRREGARRKGSTVSSQPVCAPYHGFFCVVLFYFLVKSTHRENTPAICLWELE